jgi:membrane protease YdiL (CAAX protease family)
MVLDLSPTRRALAFYALTLALAILVRLAVPLVGEASLPLTMLTPTVATIIMLSVVSPEGSFRDALRSLGLDVAGLKAWPLAILAPIAIFIVGLAIMVAAGFTTLATIPPDQSFLLGAPDIAIGFIVGSLFAVGEEIGWRGYMLPRMTGFPLLSAMLIVGFLHGVWHLPLLMTTDYYHAGSLVIVVPLFLITLTLAGVFYGYLRVWSGSVWPVALAHGAVNSGWNFTNDLSTNKSPLVSEYIGGESGLMMIAGLLVIAAVIARYMKRNKLSF